MPDLFIRHDGEKSTVPFQPGPSLRHILDNTKTRVRSGCRGMGACGLCRVCIVAGFGGEPTDNERIHLDSGEIAQGIRLACQVFPEADMEIAILAKAPASVWRNLDFEGTPDIQEPSESRNRNRDDSQPSYGAAIDLGTSHIGLHLFDLSSRQWIAGRHGPNPQSAFGSDVMTRLVAASESRDSAAAMSGLAVEAFGKALWDIASREGLEINRLNRIIVVGNTAMLSLLSDQGQGLLLQPKNWTLPIKCIPDTTPAWADSWGTASSPEIIMLPPLGGFVGSDLMAGLFVTGLMDQPPGSLFIDFGTNSEMALWDGKTLWGTSAAGGPAFEGSGIRCGMPADEGAIFNARIENGEFVYDVLGGVEPLGICGSGLVDIIACLVQMDSLTTTGKFTPDFSGKGARLVEGERPIVVSKRDVDVFQRAKAAIGMGIQALMEKAGMVTNDLSRIFVGGAFGRFLNTSNARDIGLLPSVEPSKIKLCGNTALCGCSKTLFLRDPVRSFEKIAQKAELINLSACSDADVRFMENLYLRPF